MIILRIRPQKAFSITTAELKRVSSPGQYMTVEGTVRSSHLDDSREELRQIATLCEELLPGSLYTRYADKKAFRHESDFWATEDTTVRQYVKRMADTRLIKAVRLAASQDIPILYAADKDTPLHITDRLRLREAQEVTPVMNFTRHADGTAYRLQLRIGGQLVEALSEHRLAVLTHEPGMLVLDGDILLMDDDFSGKLLLPFVTKRQVDIPRRMEGDYFRRFIRKHVTRVEINAEGFDITDVSTALQARLVVQRSVDDRPVLSLRFRYGSAEYQPDSKSRGRVTLTEEDNSFRFVRQLRDWQRERETLELLGDTSAELTSSGYLHFATSAAMIDWLRQYAPALRQQGIDIIQPSDQLYYIGPLDVEQSDTWQGDWLQTEVTVVLDGGRLRIPFRDLRGPILQGEQEYMLPTGERLIIPQEWLQRYTPLLLTASLRGNTFRRHRSQLIDGESGGRLKVEGGGSRDSPPGHSSLNPPPSTLHQETPSTLHPKVPTALRATLRPYQQTGFEWLWHNFLSQTGCCLSDEMGLGKTLQTIALLLKYKETAPRAGATQPQPGMLFSEEEMQGTAESQPADGSPPPYATSLVVAPASVVHNWRNELARFAPSLMVLDYTGGTSLRRDKRAALMRWDVVLTSYGTLAKDIDHFRKLQFGITVFDESQAFKTVSSQIHKTVASLQAFHRMALSGTPVENNLMELWSLMSILNPNLLGDAATFKRGFVAPIAQQMEETRRSLLQRLIAPYFLKRTKEEVLNDLPERQDEVVLCTMTDEQTSRYAEELSKARNEWLDPQAKEKNRQLNMMAAIQRLRRIANGEGKMAVVFEQLENLRGTRHKVLLFSEYVTMLEQVGDEMRRRGWRFDMLTGQTQRREQVIDHFQQEADCQFFLISLKAGGVGLNLTAADYVFLLDPWWNQAAEEQAIARSHRIGQHHPVFVYRFVSTGTLEEQILNLQERKQTLIDSVMPFLL